MRTGFGCWCDGTADSAAGGTAGDTAGGVAGARARRGADGE
jgi:hypothetical protein